MCEKTSCMICGKELQFVSPTHLRYEHGITMEEYRKRYPESPLISETFKHKLEKSNTKKWRDPEQRLKQSQMGFYKDPQYIQKLSRIREERWKNSDVYTNPEYIRSLSDARISFYSLPENRQKILGENNPNWRGGLSLEPYGPEFGDELKGEIKKRDNHTCQLCGVSKSLCVHHIDYDKKNNKSSNLITLCNRCNIKVNSNRSCWIKYFSGVD